MTRSSITLRFGAFENTSFSISFGHGEVTRAMAIRPEYQAVKEP